MSTKTPSPPLFRSVLGSQYSEGARRLRAELKRRGWSQAYAEKRLGVSAGLVNRWVHGERTPGRELALKLRDRFGIALHLWDEPPAEDDEPKTGTEG